jgi:putative ABC transport system permease protein
MGPRLLRYHLRSVLARRAVAAAVALGVAVATFVACATTMLSSSIDVLFRPRSDPASVVVLAAGAASEVESNLDAERRRRLLAMPQVKRAGDEPVATSELVLVLTLRQKGAARSSNVVLRGVGPEGLRYRPRLRVVEGRAPRPGAAEAIVGRSIRGRFEGLDVGGRLEFGENKSVAVVGAFEEDGAAGEAEVFMDVGVMQELFGRVGVFSSVRLDLASPAAFDAFKAEVEGGKSLGLHAVRAVDHEVAAAADLAGLVTALGGSVGALLTAGASLGALVAMYGSVASRKREIGTLRALGFSGATILFGILSEALAVGLVGGALGVAASFALTRASVSLVGPNWAEVRIVFVPTAQVLVSGGLVALAISLVGGFFPARRALRYRAIDAMRA